MRALCRLAWRPCLPSNYRGLIASFPRRSFHSSLRLRNKLEPLLPERSEDDQFSEMMDDRTNALLRSLGIDASQFEAQVPAKRAEIPVTSEGEAAPVSSNSEQEAEAISEKTPDTTGIDSDRKARATAPEIFSDKGVITAKSVPAVQKAGQPAAAKPAFTYFIDTQDIYAELRAAGLATGQAELLMRTIQELINDLVITCKSRAVPVSAAANEAYLFDAASSEVRNEISNSRQSQTTTYRSGLARLQRDVEILEHAATEMTNLLKSDMDIEVHERKNSARTEENVIQLKIQELNHKISTRLNSDLKSEIENLRWQITRRSLTAIGLVAALFIWITQTTSSKKTAKSQERQRNTSGRPVPVQILAPSMSSSDELPFENSSPSHVDDINAITTNESSFGDATQPPKADLTSDRGVEHETIVSSDSDEQDS